VRIPANGWCALLSLSLSLRTVTCYYACAYNTFNHSKLHPLYLKRKDRDWNWGKKGDSNDNIHAFRGSPLCFERSMRLGRVSF